VLGGGERDELGLVVVEEAQRLSALVEKLLDLSRLQAGAAEPRRDWCSLEEVVRTAVDDVAADDGASFALSFDPDLPLVQADAAQLERVFVNLLENARRYSGGHPVNVRARVVGGKMSIRVIDRGPGMSATQLRRAFEPFYRDATSDAHPGSGLGLAIVRGFVEANGGRVHAESLRGHGTVFAIELPLAERPATILERS
jgi:two-component system sensor histidine kinase KdpD